MSRNKSNSSRQSSSNYQTLALWISLIWSVITLELSSYSRGYLMSLTSWSLLLATRVSAQPPQLRTIVPEFQLDTMDADGHYSPALAPLVLGGWVVAWNGGASQVIYIKQYN